MTGTYRINPRIRAYGKARIDVTRRAQDEKEWQSLWKAPAHPYPFTPGEGWKFCIEYKVDDYAAEIGLFIDVLGFSVYSFSPSFAQFISPDQGIFFGISAAQEGEQSTLPDTLRLQLKVGDLLASVQELESRGIIFEQPPTAVQEGASLHLAVFRTPHGIPVDLWGEIEVSAAQAIAAEEHASLVESSGPQRADSAQNPGLDELPPDAEAPVLAAVDEKVGEPEEVSPVKKEQASLWGHFSRSVSGLKDKSLHAMDSAREKAPGNGEITYAPIEEDDVELDDTDHDEEFP